MSAISDTTSLETVFIPSSEDSQAMQSPSSVPVALQAIQASAASQPVTTEVSSTHRFVDASARGCDMGLRGYEKKHFSETIGKFPGRCQGLSFLRAYVSRYCQMSSAGDVLDVAETLKHKKDKLAAMADAGDVGFTTDSGDADRPKNCTHIRCVHKGLTFSDPEEPWEVDGWIQRRPYIFIEGNEHILLIKNCEVEKYDGGKDEIKKQVFNATTGKFEDITTEQMFVLFQQLRISSESLILVFNALKTFSAIETYVNSSTIQSEDAEGNFYHEKQSSGFCSIHAANAFYGEGVVKPVELRAYLAEVFRDTSALEAPIRDQEAGGADFSTSVSAAVIDIDDGVDLGIMTGYLAKLVVDGVITDASFATTRCGTITCDTEQNIKLQTGEDTTPLNAQFFEDKDRIAIGLARPLHSIAYRKNTDGFWVKIDSFMSGQTQISDMIAEIKKCFSRQDNLPIAVLFKAD